MERSTRQRDAIRHVFEKVDRPLGPQEVLHIAQKQVPGLGVATVYRTVKTLVDQGWLIPVELPGEPPRYEVAGKSHHHHFHCKKCDSVYEIEGCPGNLRGLMPKGFRLDRHELVLYGLCEKCNRQ